MELKFRAWCKLSQNMIPQATIQQLITQKSNTFTEKQLEDEMVFLQYTGVKDKNSIEVYSGDLIQFSDKLEWYRMPFQSNEEREKILTDHAKYPYERRVVDLPTDYEWLLSSEIQMYWEVIGNIYENPELLEV